MSTSRETRLRRSARKLVQGSAVLSLAVGSLLWDVPSASAEPECLNSSSDFDQDGTTDIVVGIPGGSGRAGAVQVRLSNEGEPFTRTLTGVSGFGSAVTSLSSYGHEGDDELCSQLVVGSPDESLSSDRPLSGVVHVYAWRADAHQFVSRGVFAPQHHGVGSDEQSGAHFGAALAAKQSPGDDGDPGPQRLYVGAPGFDLHGVRDAGRVTSFWIDSDEDPSAYASKDLDYGYEYMPDVPSAGGALGSSLSIDGGLLAAGAPGQTARGVAGAGTVLVEKYNHGPDDFLPEELSQARVGVPGSPEKGDRFGAAVHLAADSSGRTTLVVGAPGEDLGRKANAGAVTVARMSPTTGEPVGTVRAVHQDSSGMAGTAEGGDAFGSALTSFGDIDAHTFLVGSPGEDVGRARDAGMVQTIGHGTGWTQNTKGVPGNSETGDRMGASLGGSVAAGADEPLIGVPGEDSSTGAVVVGLPSKGHPAGYLKGTRAGNRFGFVVGL